MPCLHKKVFALAKDGVPVSSLRDYVSRTFRAPYRPPRVDTIATCRLLWDCDSFCDAPGIE